MAGKFSIDAIFSAHDDMTKMIAKIERSASGFGRGLQKDFGGLGKNFSAVGESIGKIAKTAAIAGGALAGLAGAGIVSVVTASNDLGDSLGKVASIIEPMSGTVEDATNRMKDSALSWSKAHTDSAKSFVDTSYQMLSAGLNERQALAATSSAMTLATAAMGDATQAGQLLATLYNNMGNKLKDPTEEFAHLGDVVAQTQAVFQFANFDALNEGLKYGVPAALQYGVNLEQVSTAMGMLNNAGLQGSQAGTSWAASMSKMIHASHALGFAIAKTADGGMDFGATLLNLHNKIGPVAKMSDTMKLSLQKAFGEEGVRAISLMADNAADFSTQLGKVSQNAGVAARAQGIIEKAGSGPFKIMMNRWEDAKVAMGDALTPVLGPIISGVGKVVDSIGSWVTANQGLITGGIQNFLAKAAPIVQDLASAFAEGFTAIMPAVKQFAAFMLSDFGSGAEWMVVLKRGAQILGGLAVAAIGAAAVFGGVLAVAFADLVTAADWVIGAFNSMVAGIGSVLFAVDNFFADLGAKWRAFSFQALADYLVDGLVNGIKSGAYRVADAVKNLGSDALNALKSIWDSHSPAMAFTIEGGNAADGVVNGIKAGIPDAVRASKAMADQVLGAMSLGAPSFAASAVNSTPAARMFEAGSSWMPQVNAPSLGSLGTDQSYAARVPPPVTNADAAPAVASSRGGSDDARLEQLLQRLLDRSSAAGGVLTVRAEKGSSAEVSEQPKGGGSIKLAPSGGF